MVDYGPEQRASRDVSAADRDVDSRSMNSNAKASPPPTPNTSVFRDLRARNKRRERVAKLLEPQRQLRIERGLDAQLERWARDRS